MRERAQTRFATMLPRMEGFSYMERQDKLGLFPMVYRRLRILWSFFIMRVINMGECDNLFSGIRVPKTGGGESGCIYWRSEGNVYHTFGGEYLEQPVRELAEAGTITVL